MVHSAYGGPVSPSLALTGSSNLDRDMSARVRLRWLMKLAPALLAYPGGTAFSQESDAARRRITEFVLTRALMIESPRTTRLSFLSDPESAATARPEQVPAVLIWEAFFRGALLVTGRTSSARPIALHYNPYMDVAVVQGCDAALSTARQCQQFCAVPGEVLLGSSADSPTPTWLKTLAPLTAMVDTTRTRVARFRDAHPARDSNAVAWTRQYCRPDWHDRAVFRAMNAIAANTEVDRTELGRAIGNYLKQHGNTNGARASGADAAITYLLVHLGEFKVAGAIGIPGGARILLFSPKRSGWQTVAMLYGPESSANGGQPTLLDAIVLSFATGDQQ